jgi:hypothetical protein
MNRMNGVYYPQRNKFIFPKLIGLYDYEYRQTSSSSHFVTFLIPHIPEFVQFTYGLAKRHYYK